MAHTPIALALLIWLALAPESLAATPDEIAKSTKQAQTFLIQRYRAGMPRVDNEHGIGPAAIAGLALLSSGTPQDDPAMKTLTPAIRDAAFTESRTYQISLCLLFLDKLGDKRDAPLIQVLAIRLLAGQNGRGGWGYRCTETVPAGDERRLRAVIVAPRQPDRAAPVAGGAKNAINGRLHPEIEAYGRGLLDSRDNGDFWDDNSNTQFAIMGVWVARKHGVPVEAALDKIEQRFLAMQDLQTGGWPYSGLVGGPGSQSMVCAGLLGLATSVGRREERRLTAEGVKKPPAKAASGDKPDVRKGPVPAPMEPAAAAIHRAWVVLGAILANEDRKRGQAGSKPFDRAGDHGDGDLYFLWSLARTGLVYGVEKVNGIDWYQLGAESIVRSQNPDGSWGKGRYGADVDTAFALLFLARADVVHDLTAWVSKAPGTAELRGARSETARSAIIPPAKITPSTGAAQRPTTSETDGAASLIARLIAIKDAEWPKALARVRDARGGEFTRALVLAIHRLDGSRKTEAREALAERLTRMNAETIRAMMASEDSELRCGAVLAGAMKDEKEHIPDLIEHLTDNDSRVARAAKAGLRSLSGGKDFGPSVGAEAEEWKAAAVAWKTWWATQKK